MSKIKLITKLNKQFDLNIPIDYPIRSHQRKHKSSGAYSWFFRGSNTVLNEYGSTLTIRELLKYEEYEIYSDGVFKDIVPKGY